MADNDIYTVPITENGTYVLERTNDQPCLMQNDITLQVNVDDKVLVVSEGGSVSGTTLVLTTTEV